MRTWVLADNKAGHRSQSLGVCEALNVLPKIIELKKRPLQGVLEQVHPLLGITNTTDLKTEAAPALIIGTGTHVAPVTAWCKQCYPSAITVQIMPGRWASKVDLSISFAHDRDVGADLILQTAPHRIFPAKLTQVAQEWETQLRPYKSPRLGVIVGGSNKTVDFTVKEAQALAHRVLLLAQETGAQSLLVTTSRRTGTDQSRAICEILADSDYQLLFYDPEHQDPRENPYQAILACADQLMVTAESFSMVSECLSAGKPVEIYGKHWNLGKFTGVWDDAVPQANSAEVIAERIGELLG